MKASNAESDDYFGSSVALSGDTIQAEDSSQTIITNGGTQVVNNSATRAGAVYVFVRDGETWESASLFEGKMQTLTIGMGRRLVDGDTIVVGTSMEGSNQTTITNGDTSSADNSAYGWSYVYVRNGDTWSQQAYLKASNAEACRRISEALMISEIR